mmetsp:Transcript_99993/g.305659  ORF Transcript_99993/g.305659 Transcript_99993/m.305659 type:complete len:254 (+) Transcript_99993:516-1277(+)
MGVYRRAGAVLDAREDFRPRDKGVLRADWRAAGAAEVRVWIHSRPMGLEGQGLHREDLTEIPQGPLPPRFDHPRLRVVHQRIRLQLRPQRQELVQGLWLQQRHAAPPEGAAVRLRAGEPRAHRRQPEAKVGEHQLPRHGPCEGLDSAWRRSRRDLPRGLEAQLRAQPEPQLLHQRSAALVRAAVASLAQRRRPLLVQRRGRNGFLHVPLLERRPKRGASIQQRDVEGIQEAIFFVEPCLHARVGPAGGDRVDR